MEEGCLEAQAGQGVFTTLVYSSALQMQKLLSVSPELNRLLGQTSSSETLIYQVLTLVSIGS